MFDRKNNRSRRHKKQSRKVRRNITFNCKKMMEQTAENTVDRHRTEFYWLTHYCQRLTTLTTRVPCLDLFAVYHQRTIEDGPSTAHVVDLPDVLLMPRYTVIVSVGVSPSQFCLVSVTHPFAVVAQLDNCVCRNGGRNTAEYNADACSQPDSCAFAALATRRDMTASCPGTC